MCWYALSVVSGVWNVVGGSTDLVGLQQCSYVVRLMPVVYKLCGLPV